MKILTGVVESNKDLLSRGTLYVSTKDEEFLTVIYTSPYGGGFSSEGRSGLFAIPENNSRILFVQTDSSPYEYFYLTTIHAARFDDGTGESPIVGNNLEEGLIPKGVYVSGKPSRVMLRDPEGNKLSLNYVSDKDEGILKGVELATKDQKRILLSDNPQAYGIFIKNEEDDGIIISSRYKGGHSAGPLMPPRSIEMRTKGKINVYSSKGSIDLTVNDGADINIVNKSWGFGGSIIPPIPFAGPPLVPGLFPYGNIRLSSDVRDVYIHAGQKHRSLQRPPPVSLGLVAWPGTIHRSRVMVNAFGQFSTIQMSSDGSIVIRAPYESIYLHGKNIHIKGELGVNIESKLGLNLTAGTTIKMTANLLGLGGQVEGLDPRIVGYTGDPTEEARGLTYDSAAYAATIVDPGQFQPTTFGHIELGIGATIQGLRVDLAPLFPTLRAARASHPLPQLGEYDYKT